MSPQKLVLLTSDDGAVVLSKVILAPTSPKAEQVSSYVVESSRTAEVLAFVKRAEALECFEEEVERSNAQ
jgi:hypothetical protein